MQLTTRHRDTEKQEGKKEKQVFFLPFCLSLCLCVSVVQIVAKPFTSLPCPLIDHVPLTSRTSFASSSTGRSPDLIASDAGTSFGPG